MSMAQDNIRKTILRLKSRLLDDQVGMAPASMLDCAAHMLLYLEVRDSVHRIALQFLLERFGATRANLGYGSPSLPLFVSSAIETAHGVAVPLTDQPIPNYAEAVQRVWRSAEPVYLNSNSAAGIAGIWAAAQTKSKLARRLETARHIFGMVCIDDTLTERQWPLSDINYLDQFSQRFLAPILGTLEDVWAPRASVLTSAEIAVVELAVRGFTYKEIANALGKATNTVDNQLRSARAKLGARNQVELARAFSRWSSG
jgi:DNA-binding CsgD family transcriptional regulator